MNFITYGVPESATLNIMIAISYDLESREMTVTRTRGRKKSSESVTLDDSQDSQIRLLAVDNQTEAMSIFGRAVRERDGDNNDDSYYN